MSTTKRRAKKRQPIKVASEAAELSNDEFFYKSLTKSVPKLSDHARDAVELISDEDNISANVDGKQATIDRGIELVQAKDDARRKEVTEKGRRQQNKYIRGSVEEISNDDEGGDAADEDFENDRNEEQRNEEREPGSTTDGNVEDDEEGGGDDADDDEDDSKVKNVKFTKEFGSSDELLKAVEKLVAKSEQQAEDAAGADLYWEVKYEHPKF